jgi:hypothetical protein
MGRRLKYSIDEKIFRERLEIAIIECKRKWGNKEISGTWDGIKESIFRCFVEREKLPQRIKKEMLKNREVTKP